MNKKPLPDVPQPREGFDLSADGFEPSMFDIISVAVSRCLRPLSNALKIGGPLTNQILDCLALELTKHERRAKRSRQWLKLSEDSAL